MSDLDFNDDVDLDEAMELADDARKAAREDAIALAAAGEVLPEARDGYVNPVRLDPILWMPPVLPAKPSLREIDPAYDAYRKADRPFRRAFGRLGGASRRSQVRTAHALARLVQEES